MDEHGNNDSKDSKSIQRIHARAALYAAPETELTAREFVRIMGVRALSTNQLRPPSLVHVGSSKRAPFSEWLEQLKRIRIEPEPSGDEPSLAELRRRGRKR